VYTVDWGIPDMVIPGERREPATPRQLLRWTGHIVLNTDQVDVRGTDVWGVLAIEFEAGGQQQRLAACFAAIAW
jgi:hypothetical protein